MLILLLHSIHFVPKPFSSTFPSVSLKNRSHHSLKQQALQNKHFSLWSERTTDTALRASVVYIATRWTSMPKETVIYALLKLKS